MCEGRMKHKIEGIVGLWKTLSAKGAKINGNPQIGTRVTLLVD